MAEFEARTEIDVPASDVHTYLLDFEQYGPYSEYVSDVTRQRGGRSVPGFILAIEWRFLQWEVQTEVTSIDPPHRIGFRVNSGIAAVGEWVIETQSPIEPIEAGCIVWFRVQYDPRSLSAEAIDLPSFIPVETVINQVAAGIEADIRRVIEGIVMDLEGVSRDIDIQITDTRCDD